MALKGTLTTNKYDGARYYKLSWTATQDIASNTSTIKWTLSAESSGWWAERTLKLTIAGKEVYSKTERVERWDGTIKSGSLTVTHDSKGEKTFSIKLEAAVYGSSVNLKGSGEFTLDPIPRQATILTAPNFNDTGNPTMTYSNPAGNSVTSLEAAIYNADGSQSYIPYKDDISKTGTRYTFNLTDAEREVLCKAAQSNTLPIRYYLRTKIGENTYLSFIDKTFSIVDADPIITASVIDTNETTVALTGDNTKLIKYFSNATATMSAEAQKFAAIDEDLYIIRNGNNSGYGKTHTFENVEDSEFIFLAEDSRGNVGTDTLAPTMINYTKLTCNIANSRPDAFGSMTVSCSGNYFNDTFGEVENTLIVQYRYAVWGNALPEEWTDMEFTTSGNHYSASADFVIPDFNQQLYYSFETRAIDKLSVVSSAPSNVKSLPVFHWGENDVVFEVPVIFKEGTEGIELSGDQTFDNVNVKGNLRLKGDADYGNALLFGDGANCYITEPNDDEMMIHAQKIYLDASSGVFVDGYAIPILDKGIWTPMLNSSVISSYSTQYGWYSKMGQFVTIGFYIKATCKSGYTSTGISISGMPFTPLYSAAGGGMCSGAYVAANQNFQCYVAETDRTITARTQACNNTTATNLTTSASGCFYRSSGGEITLSGTISFMANS